MPVYEIKLIRAQSLMAALFIRFNTNSIYKLASWIIIRMCFKVVSTIFIWYLCDNTKYYFVELLLEYNNRRETFFYITIYSLKKNLLCFDKYWGILKIVTIVIAIKIPNANPSDPRSFTHFCIFFTHQSLDLPFFLLAPISPSPFLFCTLCSSKYVTLACQY